MNYFKIIFSFIFIFSLYSCSNHDYQDNCFSSINSVSYLTRSSEDQNKDKVLYKDVLLLTKGLNRVYDECVNAADLIHCIVDEANDTLLYACNNINGGWVIYTSDTRLPAIIMQSSEGSIEEILQDDNSNIWIQSLVQDMKYIRETQDDDLYFSKEEINQNKDFWKSLSDPNSFLVTNNQISTRGKEIEVDSIIPPNLLTGHYEYYATYKTEEIYDTSDIMIKTNWSQSHPYNIYCPFKSNSSDRAPAGSEAIAAAQMLYFMNSEFGIPQKAPSEAYCYHRVDDSITNWEQTNYSETIWDEMQLNGIAAAPLIADIGRRLNMKYGNDESYADPKNIVKKVFAAYGINSYHKAFDSEILKDNLLNNMPVIIEARDKYAPHPYTFIVDRYRRSRIKTTHVYMWVYDDIPDNVRVPYVPDSVTISYSAPYIDQIGMNWGFGFNYNQWFPLMGKWRLNDAPYNFNENRKMICIDISGLQRKTK